jgi:quinol monooxygenase YgiN
VNTTGKAQLTMIIDSPAELEAEGDRIFKQHEAWMEKSHYRQGEKALLQYNVAKSPGNNGNVIFVLTEVYETSAGIEDHIKQAHADAHFEPFSKWREQCTVTFVRNASIIQSLW